MLNWIWLTFFICAFLSGLGQYFFNGDKEVFTHLVTSMFDMSKLSFDIALGLVGILSFWMGMLKVAEQAGLVEQLAKLLAPLFRRLMPDVPAGHPALGHISMNLAANMMGLDNAATPIGLKAMQSLQEINAEKDTASNPQILFLVLNTSSVTIFPITILMYRAQLGSNDPAAVFLPILLATSASTLLGLLMVVWVQGLKIFDRVVAVYFTGMGLFLFILISYLSRLPPEQLSQTSSFIANTLLFSIIILFIVVATIRKINVYESFIDGAKEGFSVAISILPYLLAMLVAIGVLRASGMLDYLLSGIRWLLEGINVDTAFVDALPTALMQPLSGSGARAMMIETINTHGVDSFPAQVAATIQGSTETTFYVIAVYFGAVGIKRIRHAATCGLFADIVGITTAILVSYWFFM
ncbi:nucleoside recognition domain-containing protein [Agarilytica rhodophyticola]|uniref:nucleoside recognition domain-containing protein n=1 Tax=Agarilytica rhodophyticola TaxID=1737490 RepID=UPI000B346014|nr:spore maturation protein [Agarilytica rhodophyticola]